MQAVFNQVLDFRILTHAGGKVIVHFGKVVGAECRDVGIAEFLGQELSNLLCVVICAARVCVIRAMPITESGASRSPNPAHGDHPIRAMPITGQA